MANVIDNLRNLSASHRKRVDNARAIAERIKKVAEAAAETSRELKSPKG